MIPVDLDDTRTLVDWLRKQYQGRTVVIADDGTIQKFTRKGLEASAKRKGKKQRQIYAGLDSLLEGAIFDHFEETDSKHKHLLGQNVYYAATKIGDKLFAVRFKVDMPKNKTLPSYKDHKVSEIEIAPALYAGPRQESASYPPAALAEANPGAISAINIDVLKGIVNPSRIEDGVLYQTGTTSRGALYVSDDGRYTITITDKADLSTLIHESAHIFSLEMQRLVDLGMADEALLSDLKAVQEWLDKEVTEAEIKRVYDKSLKKLAEFNKTAWTKLTDEQRARATVRAREEYFARGFEAYLMEGKSPTGKLANAFARFKHWLTAIYRDSKRLGVNLDDNIRTVFDRIMATDLEMEQTAAANELFSITQAQLDALGLTGNERLFVSGLMDAAKRKASESIQNARNKRRKERLKQYREDAEEELSESPLYTALADMKKAPIDIDFIEENFGPEIAKEIRRKIPRKTKSGGADPEIFAAEHGFPSAEVMIEAILSNPSYERAVDLVVAAKDKEFDSDFDATTFLLATEEAKLQVEIVGKYLAKALKQNHVDQAVIEMFVSKEMAGMPMGNQWTKGQPKALDRRGATSKKAYEAAMRNALRAERSALAKGDFLMALDQNLKARINMEFVKQSDALAQRQKKLERAVKRFIGMKDADPRARFFVMDIALRYGLGKNNPRLADGKNNQTIDAWIEEAQGEGYKLFFDNDVVKGTTYRSWQEISVADFQNVDQAITQIIKTERSQRQYTSLSRTLTLEDLTQQMAESILSNLPVREKSLDDPKAITKFLKGAHAWHSKVEFICYKLDGQKHGIVWEHVFGIIAAAENQQNIMMEKASKKLISNELFGMYTRKEWRSMMKDKELVAEAGAKLTKAERIAVALNMGNEGNLERLMTGNEWTMAQLNAIVEPLDQRDWNFVQAVWRYLDTFREPAFALQEKMTGFRPTAVAARKVRTKFGEIEGGYYPIAYKKDDESESLTLMSQDMDAALFGKRSSTYAITSHGHAEERARYGTGEPLRLDLSVMTRHVYNVIHDLTHREAVVDVGKVIRHPKVKNAIIGTIGKEQYNQLMPWLKDVAAPAYEPQHLVNKLAHWARTATTIMSMGLKATTIIVQPIGFTQTIEMLGREYAMRGLAHVYKNPTPSGFLEVFEQVKALSPFMANRIKSFDRDVNDMQNKLMKSGAGLFGWTDWLRDNAFVPMGWVQMGVDLPTWCGAYEKGLKDFEGNEQKAIDYADSMVRMSQSSGSVKDQAQIQRGGEVMKLFTMFYSYFNDLYNIGALRIDGLKKDHSPAGIFRAANSALLLWFIPSVLSEFIAGRGPDDDENKSLWALKQILLYPTQSVILLRDIVRPMVEPYGYQITPAAGAFESLSKFTNSIKKAYEKKDISVMARPTAEMAGYLSRLPLKQTIITTGNLLDYFSGDDPDFYLRDLTYVKPKDRRK